MIFMFFLFTLFTFQTIVCSQSTHQEKNDKSNFCFKKNSHITQFLCSFLSDVSILGHLYSTGLDSLTLDLSFDKWTLRTFCGGF